MVKDTDPGEGTELGNNMVGRDTPEPNARGDCARPACGQRSVNRESPGFIRGECQEVVLVYQQSANGGNNMACSKQKSSKKTGGKPRKK